MKIRTIKNLKQELPSCSVSASAGMNPLGGIEEKVVLKPMKRVIVTQK